MASFDPTDPDQVRAAAADAWRQQWPGAQVASLERVTAATSTWVWFVELDAAVGAELPAEVRGAHVLRVFREGADDDAWREHLLGDRLGTVGLPVPAPRWAGRIGPHPALLQARLPGRPAAELLGSTRLPGLVRDLGALQARLHADGPTDLDVPRHSAAGYLTADLARRRDAVAEPDRSGTWAWLQRTAADDVPADAVLCHGDFHPLNVLVDDGSLGLVDWTDACIADRHHDVARTIAIYRLASVIAERRSERMVLTALRGWLGRTHRRAYEARAGVRLDDLALAWWQVVHLYRGWLQLSELAEGTVVDQGSSTTARFPPGLRDRLLDRCVDLRRRFDHPSTST